jgi:hypothetical protein
MTTLADIEFDTSEPDGTVGKEDSDENARSDHVDVRDERDWTKLRKATPLNALLKSTVWWADGLPLEVRPQTLMAKFPRLANMAAASWTNASAFHDYLEVLLIDRRGKRKGFPPEVLIEFEQLRTYFLYGWYKAKTGISIYREGPPDAISAQ